MPLIAAYHRPTSVEDALLLLAGPNRAVLGGGTAVNADRAPSDLEVVDLQALGLDTITPTGTPTGTSSGSGEAGQVRLGAMATLGAVADSELIPAWLRTIARAEAPSTLRHLSTVGGSVAARSGESVFVAALLVCAATAEMAGADDTPLAELVENGVPTGAIITGITIDTSGSGDAAATGRTPADVPIVAAVARTFDGQTTLALTGVGPTPVLADPANPTAGLNPPADFRGTSQYRLTLAKVLSERAVEATR